MKLISGQYSRPPTPSDNSFPILRTVFLCKNDRVLCTQYHARIVPVCTSGRLDCGCRLGSNNTRRPLKKGETDKSAVAKHVWDMSHNMDWSNTTAMDCDPQSLPRKIREAIHIRNSKGHSLINRDCGLEVSYMWDTLFEKTTSSNP